MPIRDYPFFAVNPEASDASGLVYLGGPQARPYLWVRIANPATDQAIIVPAVVDTGADGFVVPASDAETLGHDLRATTPRRINTVRGTTNAYPHTAALEVLGILPNGYPDETVVLYPIEKMVVHFTVGLKAYLIGQAPFLSRFILTINYPEKKFSVRLPGHGN